jgi:mono/diheme cytochrome c family protein
MRNMLDNLGLAARFAFLPLIGGIAMAPTAAAAMPAGVHTQLIGAAMSGVQKIDGDAGDPFNGRKIFLKNNCYICHGGRGGGGMCISLRDARPDQDLVQKAVKDGMPQGMPSFNQFVTSQEIDDLAAYFASMRTAAEPTFTHWWEVAPTQ